MPDYSKGKIYKVVCSETGNVYIGSTIHSLSKRLINHNYTSNRCETRHFIDPKIELIEEYQCETKEQLLWREREWIEKTDCVNNFRPIVTIKEKKEQRKRLDYKRYELKKDIIKQKRNEYYHKNKERINEKFNCECGGKYQYNSKARHLKSKKHQAFVSGLTINR